MFRRKVCWRTVGGGWSSWPDMKSLRQRLLGLIRTVHIYLSVGALGLLLFFGVTGLMLNHGERLGLEEGWVSERSVSVSAEALAGEDRLRMVEALRAAVGEVGAMDSIDVDEQEMRVVFRKPGVRTEAVVQRASGEALVMIESRGVMGLMSDLHRGKAAGRWWLVIDAGAVSLVVVSVTGVVLLLSLPKRRGAGVLLLVLGSVACLVGFWLQV